MVNELVHSCIGLDDHHAASQLVKERAVIISLRMQHAHSTGAKRMSIGGKQRVQMRSMGEGGP